MTLIKQEAREPRKQFLDPSERILEVLFGLIMVLTFTGSLSVATAGREDVKEMLIGALGCNIAWGLIDGLMYLMAVLAERGRNIFTLRDVKRAASAEAAHRVIAEALPESLAAVLRPAELETMRQGMSRLPDPPARPRLVRDDFIAALGVFLLVFLSTFPVTIPFVVMRETMPAMRVSNAIAVAMLFLTGYAFGRTAGYRAWLTGLTMVVLGGVLVVITIALGG
jgi:VIT1/CCC1 family predicted Fe2+/Mn2+ transporter